MAENPINPKANAGPKKPNPAVKPITNIFITSGVIDNPPFLC
jgi:hypothetical protein